jgi:DNA-binding response OmpR family regulator
MTGDALSTEVGRFFGHAEVRYIRKPFRMAELVEAIEQVLNRNQRPGF